jgi:phosphopantetheinyl transferase
MIQLQRSEALSSPGPRARREDRRAGNESRLPFIGQALEYVPDESIAVERILALDEDLHLADHVFVHAPGVKPLSACLPVLPMTMSLEAMAETAACLAPGNGLIGVENVKAIRWIELADADRLALRIAARLESVDPARDIRRVSASISVEGQTTPAISAEFLFAPRYRLDLSLTFTEFSDPRPYDATGEEIYRARRLFHGPSYQCLTGEILLDDAGAFCEMVVRSPAELFHSLSQPQLLTDPQLLDAVGQLIGVWAMARERYVFPIGIDKLEFYRPTPAPGTRLPVRIAIVSDEAKTLQADIEVQDGAGAVWMRIRGWRMWKFRWERRFVDFRLAPETRALSEPADLPSLPDSAVCRTVAAGELSAFDMTLLARQYLHMEETPGFFEMAGASARRRQWLLGRVAAKDAARAWLSARASGETALHPASFAIDNDARGQPFVKYFPARRDPPKISIAHCDDRAIAIAHAKAVGVDIERIAPRDAAFLESISTAAERKLLDARARGGPPDATDEWTTRLWCAKEAAGKQRGTGVDGAAQRFEATMMSADGVFDILPRGDDHPFAVRTIREADFIIAYVVAPAKARKFSHCARELEAR